jgi:hypothetical protein
MPNKKITQLNYNTSPTLEDIIPIVNSGQTKQISVRDFSGLIDVKEAFEMTYVECETTKTELFKTYQQEELKEIVNFQKIKPITEEERKVLLSILTRK